MVSNNNNQPSITEPLKLVYFIGRYPELSTTFIEHEIKTLQQLDGVELQVISLRYPLTPASISPEHQKLRESTCYLVPESWQAFDWLAFIRANFYFIFLHPLVYFGTLIYLLTHPHPSLKTRLMTILHFWQGAYAAYLLRRHDFNHVHAHFMDRTAVVAMVVSRFWGKSYSMAAHANDIFVKKILMQEKIANAKFLVTDSEHNRLHFLNTYPGVDPGKIYAFHPWVDLSRFKPPANRPIHNRFHILSVGRLVEKKGHGDLIEACNLLQKQGVDFECRIVGMGPLRKELEERIARYGLKDKVQLMGGQPQEEVLRLLASWADVFVLACVIAQDGDRDGIPVSLAEAMAMELPVISTDIVGIGELVKPSAGILVPPHNPTALAEALQNIQAKSPSDRATMGCQGRAVVDSEFNLFKEVARLTDLFREAIN